MEQYKNFAFVYDELMDNVDYNMWVKYIEDIIKKENTTVQNILELACGTGNLTIPLAKKGYDIVGIDISQEMLSVAREKSANENIDIIFLDQNIVELDFDIYNLDCVLCGCDGFNYILEDDDLKILFKKIYDLLKNEGLFIFDISSYYKISQMLSNNVFGENREDTAYIWENYFDEEESLIEMNLAFFIKKENLFERFEEVHYQRAYKSDEILNILKFSGFENIKIYKDFTFSKDDGESERIFFVCKK